METVREADGSGVSFVLIQKGCLTVFPLAVWTFATKKIIYFLLEFHIQAHENDGGFAQNGPNKMGL